MAGLTAAQRLTKHGVRVTLFDKSRGPGGRLATRRMDSLTFDHGAQYFTVREASFKDQVDSWIQTGIVSLWEGRIGVAHDGEVSEKNTTTKRYVGTPRMSAITRHMATDLEVIYQTRIVRANKEQGRWMLTEEKGTPFGPYENLIITTPPPQALPFITHSPQLREEVSSIEMLPCWAVMLTFSAPLPISYDGLFIHNSPLSWVSRNNSKPDRPSQESWILHGSPEWSSQHIEAPKEDVVDTLSQSLFKAMGLNPISPHVALAHRWRYALARNPIDKGCLEDEDQHLMVCGDWCHNSRVEGAFLSGLAASERILAVSNHNN